MSLFYVDGKVIIDDIIEGSPADKAKFKKDDVLMSVNNNFSNDINQYKDILQSADEKVRVLIMRNNEPFIIDFRVGRIF